MNPDQIIKSFQVQLINGTDSITIARGNTELLIEGEGAAEAVFLLFSSTSAEGRSYGELLEMFLPDEQPKVEELLAKLIKQNFMAIEGQGMATPEKTESVSDVFFWNFQYDQESYRSFLGNHKIILVGINYINKQLCQALIAAGLNDITLVDYTDLRSIHFFDEEGKLKEDMWPTSLPRPCGDESCLDSIPLDKISFLIASSDFGGTYQLMDWNSFCIDNNIIFLPVLLDRCVGKVGPLIIPGESACYQCLESRENSNMHSAEIARIREYSAAGGQQVVGFLSSMASILGDIAAVEIIKFAGRSLPWSTGELIEVNLLAPSMKTRKVLKLPRCKACSNLSEANTNSPLKHPFMPDNYREYANAKSR